MITNYTDLQTEIAAFLQRDDLSAKIPLFIQLAEDRINADAEARDMETTATLTCTAGVGTVAIPSGLMDIIRVVVTDTPNRVLTPVSADELAAMYPGGTSAKPANYSIIGGNMQLGPIPDANYSIEFIYRATVPPLASNSTNWLLTRAPSVYLWAALVEAASYIRDTEAVAYCAQRYQQAINQLNVVDWCTSATPRVRAR